MTDRTHDTDAAQKPEREPRLTPRQRTRLFLGIAAAAAIGLAIVVAYVVAPAVSKQRAADLEQARWPTAGLERVAWAGAGRYAVIGDFQPDGVPVVVVWDRLTRESRVATGFVLVRVDASAPYVLAEPATPARISQLSTPVASYPLTGTSTYDAPAPVLGRWDLSAPGIVWRVESPNARFGSRIGDAFGSVEAIRGSGLARLAWWPPGQSAPKPTLRTPGVTTLRPVGWSASGRFFAAEQLLSAPESWPSSMPVRRLLVFAPPSASPVAGVLLPGGGIASWDAAQDRLLWAVAAPAGGLDGLDVSGRPRRVHFSLPQKDAAVLTPAENSGATPLWYSPFALGATTFWQLRGDTLAKRFNVPLDGAVWAWNESAGLIGDVPETGLGTYQTVVYYLSPKGGTPEVIYKGTRRADSKGRR